MQHEACLLVMLGHPGVYSSQAPNTSESWEEELSPEAKNSPSGHKMKDKLNPANKLKQLARNKNMFGVSHSTFFSCR
ncbi:hypothetical protein CSKR_102825 [Clonorchis sinensis]|uniref:Uncharacterized protein n=1 Tax=Clonorchis sinensis TaxID=79923 RepID=A0A419Q7W5_CLOSI|nr:hypothetical protein CSKR_102825 [Clonorchis sinensis]